MPAQCIRRPTRPPIIPCTRSKCNITGLLLFPIGRLGLSLINELAKRAPAMFLAIMQGSG